MYLQSLSLRAGSALTTRPIGSVFCLALTHIPRLLTVELIFVSRVCASCGVSVYLLGGMLFGCPSPFGWVDIMAGGVAPACGSFLALLFEGVFER